MKSMRLKSRIDLIRRYLKFEALFWIAGLVYLAVIDPYASNHLSFCPLHNLGFDFCPGCGLGRSISFILHGDIGGSLAVHPLGIPALGILGHRIVMIWYRTIQVLHIPATGGNHG